MHFLRFSALLLSFHWGNTQIQDRPRLRFVRPVAAEAVSPACPTTIETAEERVLRFASHVRLLARLLKRKLPPSIEIDDLIQPGLVAVWRAGDLPKSLMRFKIWGAMVDSIRGKEYREATRVSMTAVADSDTSEIQYSDPAPNIEQCMIADEVVRAAGAAARGQASRLEQAMTDTDPLYHPVSRSEQRVLRWRMRGEPQKAIARAMNISQQRVSQMQRRGIDNLKKKLAA